MFSLIFYLREMQKKGPSCVRESEKTEIYDEIDWTKLIREMGYKICTYPILTWKRNLIYNYQSEIVKNKRIYEETENQHEKGNGTRYNKKSMWQCHWTLLAMMYQQYSLFFLTEAPLWSPIWAILQFWTFHLHSAFYHQHASSLLKLCQMSETPTFRWGEVWMTENSFLQEVTSHNQEGSICRAMRRTCIKDVCRIGVSVHKYMFVSKCSI